MSSSASVLPRKSAEHLARYWCSGRIAAQCDDVADPGLPIIECHGIDLGAGGGDAGKMGRRFESRLMVDAPNRRMSAFTGRAARPICHRNKARGQRFEALYDVPQPLLHFRRLWREEFEGDARRSGVEIANRIGGKQAA